MEKIIFNEGNVRSNIKMQNPPAMEGMVKGLTKPSGTVSSLKPPPPPPPTVQKK